MIRRELLAAVLLALPECPADAQSTPSALPGFCLFARGVAIASSRAGTQIRAQLGRFEAKIAETATRERQAGAVDDSALMNARAQLSPAEFTRKTEAFRSRLSHQAQTTQVFARQLAEARAAALARIDSALDPVLETTRAQRGCIVVMERNNAYVYANSVDITGDIVRQLDQRLVPFDINISAP